MSIILFSLNNDTFILFFSLNKDREVEKFPCGFPGCDYESVDKGNRNKHLLTHDKSDKKRHTCGCGYNTNESSHMKRHCESKEHDFPDSVKAGFRSNKSRSKADATTAFSSSGIKVATSTPPLNVIAATRLSSSSSSSLTAKNKVNTNKEETVFTFIIDCKE